MKITLLKVYGDASVQIKRTSYLHEHTVFFLGLHVAIVVEPLAIKGDSKDYSYLNDCYFAADS